MGYKELRTWYKADLEKQIEQMIEDGTISEEEAYAVYADKLEAWESEYGDMMYDRMKDMEFGL